LLKKTKQLVFSFIKQSISANRGNVYILHTCNLLKIGVKHTHIDIFIICIYVNHC